MIFEFLRKLLWKADEGNRKRKSNESVFNDLPLKKQCLSFTSSNSKINPKMNNSNEDTMNYSNKESALESFKKSGNNVDNTKFDFLQSDNPDLLSKDKYTSKNFLLERKSADQLTLYKTHRLAEKKQYGEMLLNFIPIGAHANRELHKRVNQDDLFQNITMNQNDIPMKLKHKIGSKYLSESLSSVLSLSTRSITYCHKCAEIIGKENTENSSLSCSHVSKKIIATNTLKDELSSRNVFKHNFISEVTKKYNKRVEQCQKEIQELKKITCMLSKHNQSLREAVLEDQLNRSMKLCGVVFDEREIIEESKLPELSTEMIKCINNALSMGPSNEILVQSFGLRVTRKDIQTLAGLNWLNDEVINFYMNLLIERGNTENFPSVYAMNTFFFPKLVSSGHASLKRWTRKVDIFSKDIIVIPVHLGIHWCMSIIDLRNQSIKYYDSMGAPNHKCLQVLKQYLYDESMDKKKTPFNFQNWTFECVKDIPQQMNGSDCGVFSCVFAEYICANKALNFSQDDMPYFRNKMVYEILSVKLL